jgi:RNA polymerase sigma-70 factor (ECF subfamily)
VGGDAAAEFERLYRANVGAMTAFFARRSADRQTVADLTADTFVQVIVSFSGFDPGKGVGVRHRPPCLRRALRGAKSARGQGAAAGGAR